MVPITLSVNPKGQNVELYDTLILFFNCIWVPLKQKKKIHGTYVKCVLNEKINSQGTDLKQTHTIKLSLCQPYIQNDKDSFRILYT